MSKKTEYNHAQVVLLVTNPLHYAYLLKDFWPDWLFVVASTHGPAADFYGKDNQQVILTTQPGGLPDLYRFAREIFPSNVQYFSWKTFQFEGKTLGNNYQQVKDLEDKILIRSLIQSDLFPAHVIITKEDANQEALKSKLGDDGLVLQIPVSTGGMGTFITKTADEFTEALSHVNDGQSIVVSKMISGESYGLQCYFDGQEVIYPNWWHRDLVDIKGVCASDNPKTRYCGAIIENTPELYADRVKEIVLAIKPVLKKFGYVGIFGIDLVTDDQGKVYLIEVNPRFTAVSHLYGTLMRSLGYSEDFMSFQIKQLLNQTSEQPFNMSWPKLANSYFYLKLQNIGSSSVNLQANCKLGIYDKQLKLKNDKFGIDGLDTSTDVAIIPEVEVGRVIPAGSRHISVIGTGNPLEDGEKCLNQETRQQMDAIRSKFTS